MEHGRFVAIERRRLAVLLKILAGGLEVAEGRLGRVMVGTGVRVRQGFEGGGGLAENVACLE
jgi:hypothetical protein